MVYFLRRGMEEGKGGEGRIRGIKMMTLQLDHDVCISLVILTDNCFSLKLPDQFWERVLVF